MNKNLLTATLVLGFALATSSCITQSYSGPNGGNRLHREDPASYQGDHADTSTLIIPVDSTDVQVVCPRAIGTSQGFKLLGFIPVRLASETEAVNNMYQNARDRGCAPEGKASHFINHSVERSSNYRLLYSRPEVRASGDLVEILPPGKGMDKLIARDAARAAAASPKAEPAKQTESTAKEKSSRKRKR